MPSRHDAPLSRPSLARIPTILPDPAPDLLPPDNGDNPHWERMFFDPERWAGELLTWRPTNGGDPVKAETGKCEGASAAALFISDFHLADGSAGGDDFLDSHILPDKEIELYTGFSPAGKSRAHLLGSVLTFARRRVAEEASAPALDLVLNGDVINFLELKGRGDQLVSPKHKLLFRMLAAPGQDVQTYWLRGNHDYLVPSGPWKAGEFYVNPRLQVLAEHGDVWDKENWPPGPENKGSKWVIEAGSSFEVHAGVLRAGEVKFLMSGIDNLRPWNDEAIEEFLDRRSKHSDVAWVASYLARLKFIGAADDSAAYKGALERRKTYRDWLMVQGHTHVPALAPGVYCNTGTWTPTLVARKGKEDHIETFPFLLVYLDREGRRIEEYYTADYPAPNVPPHLTVHTPESVNALRKTYGY